MCNIVYIIGALLSTLIVHYWLLSMSLLMTIQYYIIVLGLIEKDILCVFVVCVYVLVDGHGAWSSC